MDRPTQMSPGAGSGSPAASDEKTLKIATSVSTAMYAGAENDLSGTTIGGYQLTRKIAQGGMGIVYEAIQTKLSRKVALKVLTPELASQPEFLQRFEREAKAAAALNHPNIVQVHDFGEENGRHYFIMEFIDGEDLSQNVARDGKLSIQEALEVVEQAAQALKYACSKSIIHRDIKPSNLMLTTDGRVKVSDLGLAKILNEASDVTLTGAGIGSPHFIAPEQADDARRADHRADIYALGITLLFLLTGKRPYDGGTPFSVVLAHVNKPLPSGSELGTELPAEIESLVQRMSAKNPDERYQDYNSLLADLQLVKAGYLPAAKIPSRWNSKRTVIRSVSIAAALIITFFLGWMWSHPAKGHRKNPANTAGNTAQAAVPEQQEPIAPRRPQRGPEEFRPGERQPPREFAGGPDQDRPGPPPDDPQFSQPGNSRFALPFGTLPRPQFNALPDGPVDTMMSAADVYAAKNSEQFRGIIDRYHQIQRKAAGGPRTPEIQEKIDAWATAHREAFTTAIRKYEAKMLEKIGAKDFQGAYDVWKDFPSNLRTPEVDSQVRQMLEQNLPQDFTPH